MTDLGRLNVVSLAGTRGRVVRGAAPSHYFWARVCRALAHVALVALTTVVRADDWPMLGGRPERTNVSSEKDLPVAWEAGTAKKNIKWTAPLGDVTYGSPVISGGRVFIGTNNDEPS